MVVGVLTVATAPVAVGVAPIEGVAVAAVAVGVLTAEVTMTGAPSSRKIINGFPHQCSIASVAFEGVGVGVSVGVAPEPPLKFNHEHEASRTLDMRRQANK